ncbi:hypothetical protein LTR12_017035 [Friedmanniomyces endolithicus]|nr:hypothetical protein LTR12_017035 [Friedmanniomyces endolithicus]
MIVLDGIGEEVADDARKSLTMQVDRRRATETASPATKRQSAQPFTILNDTTETSVACEEIIKPLADLLGISEDEVRRRLKRGKCVHFLPIADGVIDYIHTAPGRMVGTLAFSENLLAAENLSVVDFTKRDTCAHSTHAQYPGFNPGNLQAGGRSLQRSHYYVTKNAATAQVAG